MLNHAETLRAIPTRVGKSPALARQRWSKAGHPHAGGEISSRTDSTLLPSGPSPRGWGNRNRRRIRRGQDRAIPTRVGKSVARIVAFRRDSGPSPRGWGNPFRWPARRSGRRAIPTRVGKSGSLPRPWRRCSGHPHAGGEIARRTSRGSRGCGPSPRGWGNLGNGDQELWKKRAIPTRVGKSP